MDRSMLPVRLVFCVAEELPHDTFDLQNWTVISTTDVRAAVFAADSRYQFHIAII